MNELTVNVIATHQHDTNRLDNDMVLVVDVTDANGDTVTDLELENFEVWQVGMVGFGKINPILRQHLGNVDADLNGVYHLVPKWSMYAETQCGFCVVVKRSEDGDPDNISSGRGMAALVTQGSQD